MLLQPNLDPYPGYCLKNLLFFLAVSKSASHPKAIKHRGDWYERQGQPVGTHRQTGHLLLPEKAFQLRSFYSRTFPSKNPEEF